MNQKDARLVAVWKIVEARLTEQGLDPDTAPPELVAAMMAEVQRQAKAKIDAAMQWRDSHYEDGGHPADEFSDI